MCMLRLVLMMLVPSLRVVGHVVHGWRGLLALLLRRLLVLLYWLVMGLVVRLLLLVVLLLFVVIPLHGILVLAG